MKIILLALLLTSCVTYPRYATKYECSEMQKKKLPNLVSRCASNMTSFESSAEEIAQACYAIALKSVCTPQQYFERVDLLGNPSAAIECRYSIGKYEAIVCDN